MSNVAAAQDWMDKQYTMPTHLRDREEYGIVLGDGRALHRERNFDDASKSHDLLAQEMGIEDSHRAMSKHGGLLYSNNRAELLIRFNHDNSATKNMARHLIKTMWEPGKSIYLDNVATGDDEDTITAAPFGHRRSHEDDKSALRYIAASGPPRRANVLVHEALLRMAA